MHTLTGITRDEACRLIRSPDEALPDLLYQAAEGRDAAKGRIVTYSRKVFLPLTNLCRDVCGYCTFVRQPDDPAAHTMSPDEVLAVARAGERLGCTEALFSLGDKPELKYPAYRDWLSARVINQPSITCARCAISFCARPVCFHTSIPA